MNAAPNPTTKTFPNPTARLPAPLPLVIVVTVVATAPKDVVAPAEFTRTLLVTPLTTVTEVVNPAGTPVDVKFVSETTLDVVIGMIVDDEKSGEVVADPVIDAKVEDESAPLQDPETQVLKAHSELEVHVAP